MTRRLSGWVSSLALGAVLGCNPQVGDEYTGEPLLSLQGNVLLSEEQANTKLVPLLGFLKGEVVVLVPGEVSGDFPAKFRFDVMEPPPAESLYLESVQSVGVEVGIAQGVLVMLPADHPRQIPVSFPVLELDRQCSADDSVCTHTQRACDVADRCRERIIECADQQCVLVERLAADSPHAGEPANRGSDYKCDAKECYLVESSCDAAGVCFADVYHCTPGNYSESNGKEGGLMQTCDVRSESGDTSLVSYFDLHTVAVDYKIIYATVDVPQYGFKRGYNLVQTPTQPAEVWLESVKCKLSKTAEAVAEYNTAHGTEYHPFSLGDVVEDLAIAAWEECDTWERWKLVERPFDELLTLKLGDPELPDF